MDEIFTEQVGKFVGVAFTTGDGPDIQIEELTAYAHAAEEGGYWGEVPALPGCITEGETLDELVVNLNEAIEGWLSAQTHESLLALGVKYKVVNSLFQQPEKKALPSRFPKFDTLRFAA